MFLDDDVKILDEVKKRLGITGSYNDDALSGLIEDVKAYAISAGVDSSILESAKAYGLIARGVADLWNMGAGEGKFSEVFKMRLVQLQGTAV